MWALLMLAADPPQPEGGAPWFMSFVPLLVLVAVGYMLLLRPARNQEQQRKAMVASLKKNDRIVNSGGIIGTVESIKEKEDEVVLRGGLRITKSSIVRVLTEEPARDQKEGVA
jgi:preprotein translocase YajC subunit